MQIIDRDRALSIPPLWRMGFRPFFLGGTFFAVLAIALWLTALNGITTNPVPVGGWLAWHRHEMFFGFGAAIVSGFLLTAVQNWTGQPGLSGRHLAALAGLWVAGRLAWAGGAPVVLLLPLELAFLPTVAAIVAWQLWRVRQWRNYPVVAVLGLMAVADALVTVGALRGDAELQRRGGLAAAWVIVTLLGLIGGRVIPFFTRRGLALKGTPEDLRWVDWLAMGGGLFMIFLTLSGWSDHPQAALTVLCGSLALAHLFRVIYWYDHGIWKVPLLWSLHLAYAWLVVSLAGLALWHGGLIATLGLPLHALTVGAMGGAILAMVARVSLGHTGRELRPPAAMGMAFALLNVAALGRVGVAAMWPKVGLLLAGACWIAAFGLFCGCYAPMLLRPRADGNPG
ncbi:MAG TPA: NnrS family protein [Moraxellaceae bacterium]|nr:NnrS family protein [Moraxellaceae bacterium]